MICPRCNKQRFGITCGNCDLRHLIDENYASNDDVWLLCLTTGNLYWIITDHRCQYFPHSRRNRIDLPWLPFDITEEGLQKYLVLM